MSQAKVEQYKKEKAFSCGYNNDNTGVSDFIKKERRKA